MGAPDLLEHLRHAGLVLTLAGTDKLRVAPRGLLNDEYRAAIRAEHAALIAALRAEARPARRSANLLMTVEQGDRCHTPCWDDAEIAAFTTRVLMFLRHRIDAAAADNLAERLVLRDREGDSRCLCAECKHGRASRCPNGAPLPPEMLHHCGGFTKDNIDGQDPQG